jgi:hypothetical protein
MLLTPAAILFSPPLRFALIDITPPPAIFDACCAIEIALPLSFRHELTLPPLIDATPASPCMLAAAELARSCHFAAIITRALAL